MRALSVVVVLLLVCASGALPDASQDTPVPTPAARFEQWLDGQADDALAAGASARARARTAAAVRRRAEDVRREVMEAMGGLPEERGPLNARITGRLDRDGYRVEHLVFESLPGFFVAANVYVPTTSSGPFPAVLGTAGHSAVGKSADAYQHTWISLARRGTLVLAYDIPGQGERLEYPDATGRQSRVGAGTAEHIHVGQQALLTGTSIARYFAWDGVRALDYLLTRSDVDPARIGVAGNSGGGTQAAWLGVVEPRLAVINPSCFITSWAALWDGPGPQDMEQVLPGFLARGLDFADLLIAAAPKPYLVSSAIRDFFPIEGARATMAEAEAAYTALDAGEHLSQATNDATHGWSQPLREAAYAWFGHWFHGNELTADPVEGDVTVETAETLYASPTGQVSTSYESRTMFDLNLERAEALTRTRPPVTPARLRALLQLDEGPNAVDVVRRDPADAIGSMRTERLELEIEPGVVLPGLLLHPGADAPRGTVLVAGGCEDAPGECQADHETARAWAERGYVALALNVRGVGVFAPTRQASGYSADYQLAARAWLLGTSVVAWQTRDLLGGLTFLEREWPAADSERVIVARGIAVPAGLFAAALRPVSSVRLEHGLTSYMNLASTRDYVAPARLFLPGVLEVTDLPAVMALAAPAAVQLVQPVGADGLTIASDADLRDHLGSSVPANVRLSVEN